MNLTTNQIVTAARQKLLEAGTEILPDSTILLYANLAQDDIGRRVFPNNRIKSATITFTNGVGTLPTYFGTLYGDAKQDKLFFPELSIEDFAKETLPQSVTIENGTIKVYPTDTASVDIKYYESYPTITSAVNPTIEGYFHELIIYGILFRCFEELQDHELSTMYEEKYEKKLMQKMSAQSNYEEDNQRGGQMFNYQSLI
jgi:hypothetical protein